MRDRGDIMCVSWEYFFRRHRSAPARQMSEMCLSPASSSASTFASSSLRYWPARDQKPSRENALRSVQSCGKGEATKGDRDIMRAAQRCEPTISGIERVWVGSAQRRALHQMQHKVQRAARKARTVASPSARREAHHDMSRGGRVAYCLGPRSRSRRRETWCAAAAACPPPSTRHATD